MNKYCGKIGFATTVDDGEGVWRETITDKTYSGDILRLIRNKDSGEHINDGLRLNSQFSILMDLYFQDHFSSIRYIEYMGTKWTIESVENLYPRALITPGGIYHGDEPEPDDGGDESESETEETPTEEVGGDTGE